jgi:hypothetical protein
VANLRLAAIILHFYTPFSRSQIQWIAKLDVDVVRGTRWQQASGNGNGNANAMQYSAVLFCNWHRDILR